jgi:hypothetical protein
MPMYERTIERFKRVEHQNIEKRKAWLARGRKNESSSEWNDQLETKSDQEIHRNSNSTIFLIWISIYVWHAIKNSSIAIKNTCSLRIEEWGFGIGLRVKNNTKWSIFVLSFCNLIGGWVLKYYLTYII